MESKTTGLQPSYVTRATTANNAASFAHLFPNSPATPHSSHFVPKKVADISTPPGQIVPDAVTKIIGIEQS
jgi:hypothetical protein